MNQSKVLLNHLKQKKTLVMPDAYSPLSALMIQKMDFKAVQCSGYSIALSAGLRNEHQLTFDRNLQLTRQIVDTVNIPVMADAEDGYGSSESVKNTVNRFINVGVAGINLEDQILGCDGPLKIVDPDLMVDKLIIARETSESNGNPYFIINGRTDALKSLNSREDALNLAIERANLYLDAGADLAFITYVENLEEVKNIIKEVKGPVSIAAGMPYNINNFSIADLEKMGVARVSIPTLLILSSLGAFKKSLEFLKNDNMTELHNNEFLYPYDELSNLFNFDRSIVDD
jgi:2-methylisocitrate lyase-like PEP mutase family enzyme